MEKAYASRAMKERITAETDEATAPDSGRADRASSRSSLSPPFLVAGVGASAGGLDAFLRLIRPMPGDANLALVFVQHMSREHESMLPHLLAAQTGLKVDEASDGQRIEPGHVYVIRPNTHMTVIDGVLQVGPRPPSPIPDAPIDHLLDSMALQYGEKAVGVLLSGSGRDGATGIARIHASGGITLAQDPEQAQVDGMPRAAIATGAVAMVLPAEQLAHELLRLSEHPFFRDEAPTLGDERAPAAAPIDQLRPILQMLRRETGVDFARYKPATVQRRVRRRMALHHLADAQSYLQVMRNDPSEVGKLHDDILIHVTSFFRDPSSFEALKAQLASRLADRDEATPIRAWVPGCSSGEEAYSLAITLLEALGKDSRASVLVFGTDLSQRMIDRARAGFYPDNIARELPPEILQRYFVKQEEGYRVSTHVRERCVFARQDITHDPPFSKLDIVLCRNVLIYLDQPAQSKVIGVFHYALMPSGMLMLGRSETAGAHAELFTLIDGRWKIYSRRPGSVPIRDLEFSSRVAQFPVQQAGEPGRRRPNSRSPEQELQVEANRVLLDRYAPPSIVVDEKLVIVRSQGSTASFLELPTGDVNLDVLRMIRPGLMSPLRSALQEARERGRSVRKTGLQVVMDDKISELSLEVTPLGRPDARHYLILFEPAERPSEPGVPAPPASDPVPAVVQLQQELADTRLHLQSMIQELESANEELQAANEEILSSNEELQSTNEELDTAREELQSSNEELSTVNDELQARNLDLSKVNGDLTNLLGSVQIPIVMVTSDLRIRRFTPAAERLLNLIPSDVGRPIGHIKPNVRFPDLDQVMRDVVSTVTAHEREVEDADGNTYVATVRPYKSFDNRIDGAVLALVDVSSTLQTSRDTSEAILSTVREPVILLDGDFTIRRVNEAFTRYFDVSDAAARTRSLFEIVEGRWDTDALRRLLQEILPHQHRVQDHPIQVDLPALGRRTFLIDGRYIESNRRGERVIWLIVREAPDGTAA